MKTVGLKYTHDSAVALIEDQKLIFSIEAEKINNGDRYKKFDSIEEPYKLLLDNNINLDSIDSIIIDGWYKPIVIGDSELNVAKYTEINEKLLKKSDCEKDKSSYAHILSHMIGSYSTSDFSKKRERAYCLTWDGGQSPRVDVIDPDSDEKIKYIGNAHIIDGMIYEIMGLYVGPYKDKTFLRDSARENSKKKIFAYSIPGKIMSYIAYGKISEQLIFECFVVYKEIEEHVLGLELEKLYIENRTYLDCLFMERLSEGNEFKKTDEPSILLSIHTFLQRLLIQRLIKMIPKNENLIFSGGSALNIKWNSSILKTKHFKDIWIPPFTNDSGSALGMACTDLALEHDIWSIDWSVYCGPDIILNTPAKNWNNRKMSDVELGEFLYENDTECVVALNGKSEIGPRSLGHRSLLMSPVHLSNKKKLNDIKKREQFRPVAPICLLDDAKEAFHLVKNDKYMLYEHTIKKEWKSKIPAIVHLDDSARVQIIDESDSKFVYNVLKSFKNKSGIGILCNTSANYNGKGFFSDIKSACEWAENNNVKFVWSNNVLHYL